MKINNNPTRYFEEEMQWRQEQKNRDYGMEILKIMTIREAREMLTPLMENRIVSQQVFDKQLRQIGRLTNKYYAPDTFEHDFLTNCIWVMTWAKQDIENKSQLDRLERYWIYNESRKATPDRLNDYPLENFNTLIREAKEVPIENLYTARFKRSGGRTLTALCPFHPEKTPSFTVFTDSNTFYCFGCNEGGDSITFYQKFCGMNFVEAVKRLTGKN